MLAEKKSRNGIEGDLSDTLKIDICQTLGGTRGIEEAVSPTPTQIQFGERLKSRTPPHRVEAAVRHLNLEAK